MVDVSGTARSAARASGFPFAFIGLTASPEAASRTLGGLTTLQMLQSPAVSAAVETFGSVKLSFSSGLLEGVVTNAVVTGDATLIVYPHPIGYEIPYLLGLGGKVVIEVDGGKTQAVARTTASLGAQKLVAPPVTSAAETSSLLTIFKVNQPAISVAVAQTSAYLFVGAIGGDGFPIQELSGSASAVAQTRNTGWVLFDPPDPIGQPRFLYLVMNTGVGFDPTDGYTGQGTFVTESNPDGHIRDFERWLHLYTNVGVAFDDTDAGYSGVGTLISQTLPDGNIRDDFDRYLHNVVNVIKSRIQHDRLVIEPGIRDSMPPIPSAKPPSNSP